MTKQERVKAPQIDQVRRPRNDCVAAFLSAAVKRFAGNRYSGNQLFTSFADAISFNWSETGELPLLSHGGVIECFDRVVRDLKVNLRIDLTRFREIPYEGYYEFAQEQMKSGKFVGIGYRSSFIFGGTGDHLHISEICGVSPRHVRLRDHELANHPLISWETIEVATLSAGSGFWSISKLT